MNSRTIVFICIVLFLPHCNAFAQAPTADDLNALKAQIEALRADYEKRIQALETQLQGLQNQTQTAPKAEAAEQAIPQPIPQPQQQAAEVPAVAQGGPAGPALPVYDASAAKV